MCGALICVLPPLQDTDLWYKLAVMSEEQGFFRQALYCWNKVGPPHGMQGRTLMLHICCHVDESHPGSAA
jgi:hypothetical protein